jgi:2-methylisocitrate lyase-like PEP mutase family enzyme
MGCGTDGVFVPGLTSLDDAREISAAIALPLNVMIVPNLPDAIQLYSAGVRRISAGPAPFRVAYDSARNAVDAFLSGDFAPLGQSKLDFKTLNTMFAGPGD